MINCLGPERNLWAGHFRADSRETGSLGALGPVLFNRNPSLCAKMIEKSRCKARTVALGLCEQRHLWSHIGGLQLLVENAKKVERYERRTHAGIGPRAAGPIQGCFLWSVVKFGLRGSPGRGECRRFRREAHALKVPADRDRIGDCRYDFHLAPAE